MLAVATGGVEPGHTNPVALLDVLDAGTDARDETNTLMTRNEGRLGLHRPVALGGMQNSCTTAAFMVFGMVASFRRWLVEVPTHPSHPEKRNGRQALPLLDLDQ